MQPETTERSGRLRRLAQEAGRRIRLARVASRVFPALLAILAVGGVGVAMWSDYASGSAPLSSSIIAKPSAWSAYADTVRQSIQKRIDAGWATQQKERVRGRDESLTLRIRLKTSGDLDIVEVERPSGSIAADEYVMQTVRDMSPFGPVPAHAPEEGDTVTITANFALH